MAEAAKQKEKAQEVGRAEQVRQESLARRRAEAARQEELADDETRWREISREELARMARPQAVFEPVKKKDEEPISQAVSRPVIQETEWAKEQRGEERPKQGRPTCITYQEWEREQKFRREAENQNIERPTSNTEYRNGAGDCVSEDGR